MLDNLGNNVEVGDTVIIAIRSGRSATLGRAFVIDTAFKPQFAGGAMVNMIQVKWSNIHKYWMPARNVIRIPEEMLPEKRREKKLEAEEGVIPS